MCGIVQEEGALVCPNDGHNTFTAVRAGTGNRDMGHDAKEELTTKTSFARKYFYVFIPVALIALGLLLNIQGSTTESNGYYDGALASCFDPVTGSFMSDENFNVYGSGRFDGDSQNGTFLGRTYQECLLEMAVADSRVVSGAAQAQLGLVIARFGAIGTVIALGVAFYRRKTEKEMTSKSDRTWTNLDETGVENDSEVVRKLKRLDALLAEGKITQSEYTESRLRILSE
jgi:hypothetical protein